MEIAPETVTARSSRMPNMRKWLSKRKPQGTKIDALGDIALEQGPIQQPDVNGQAVTAAPFKDKNAKKASEDCLEASDESVGARAEGWRGEDEAADGNAEDDASVQGDDAWLVSRDFWKEAWDSDELGAARRKLLAGKPGVGHAKDQGPSKDNAKRLVRLVIDETEQKMVMYQARWGSGDNKTALGHAEDILFSALVVKDVLDSVVQFDPTGYCSAAWTVVSLGLTLAQNDKDRTDAIFQAASSLTHLIALYSRIEANYRARRPKQGKPLEDALVRVYTAILVYAAEVHDSNSARVKNVVLSLSDQPLIRLREEINSQQAVLKEWQEQVDRELEGEAHQKIAEIKTDTNEILERVDHLAKTATDTLERIDEQELEGLCDWLRDHGRGRQETIRKTLASEISWWSNSGNSHWRIGGVATRKGKGRMASKTSPDESDQDGGDQDSEISETTTDFDDLEEWEAPGNRPLELASKFSHDQDAQRRDVFFDKAFSTDSHKKAYADWVKYPQGLLWLHGDSGSGKSALCSSIIQHLGTAFEGDRTKALASWSFCSEYEDTKNLNYLLASLLGQLASECKQVPDRKLYDALRTYQRQKQFPEESRNLLNQLNKFISKADRDIFLVLDGIDQVSDRRSSQSRDMKLLDILLSLMQREHENLHVLVVSKYERDIELCFEKRLKDMLVPLDVGLGLRQALGTLITQRMNDILVLKNNESLQDNVRDRLRHGQDNNLYWASSILRQVGQCREEKEVQTALKEKRLPDNMASRYKKALDKVAENDLPRMRSILLFLMNNKRPLRQDELAAFVRLRTPKEVAEICPRALVEMAVEDNVDVFRLTHYSVEEFLKQPGLSKRLESKSGAINRGFPLQKDDAHYLITKRCLEVLLASRPATAHKKTVAIIEHTSNSDSDSYDHMSSFPVRRRRRGTMSYDASDHSSDGWRSRRTSHDESSPESDPPASSRTTGSGTIEGPARKYAAEFWYHHYNEIDDQKLTLKGLNDLDGEICSKLLLDRKARQAWLKTYDPDGPGALRGRKPPCAIYYAAKLKLGRIFVQVVEKVCQPHQDDEARRKVLDRRGLDGTALQLVASQGKSDFVDLLLERNADPNAERGILGTALYAAAAENHITVVEKLLRTLAHPGDAAQCGELGGPLHIAAFRGHHDVVQLLVKHPDFDVNYFALPFGTALQAACASRRFDTIKLLLSHGADPNIVEGCFGSAAQAAFAHLKLFPPSEVDGPLQFLQSQKAEWLEYPGFWLSAYKRASAALKPQARHSDLGNGSDWLSAQYYELFPTPQSLGLICKELEEPQQHALLANVIEQWTLPAASALYRIPVFDRLDAAVPFREQIDAITRAIPHTQNTMEHLRHSDFFNKACFWASINYVLYRIPDLVTRCLDGVFRAIRRRDHAGNEADISTILPFQWALFEFDDPWNGYSERYDWFDWVGHRERVMHDAHHGRRRYYYTRTQQLEYFDDDDSEIRVLKTPTAREQAVTGPTTKEGSFSMTNAMARSDVIATELTQRKMRQKPRESTLQTTAPDDDVESSAARNEPRASPQHSVWILSDLLDLVTCLVEFGNRCMRHQDAFTREHLENEKYDRSADACIEDLTFELYTTVIRLTLALRDHERNLEKLARPIQLLSTVRLERIKQLDTICEKRIQGLSSRSKQACTCTGRQNNNTDGPSETNTRPNMDVDRIATAVAQQVEKTITDKLAEARSAMSQDQQKEISAVINEEVTRRMGQIERNLEQKMQDEIGRQLAEAQSAQPKRGGGSIWRSIAGS